MSQNFADPQSPDESATDVPDLEDAEPTEADLIDAAIEDVDPAAEDLSVPTEEILVDPTEDLSDVVPEQVDPLRQPAPGGANDPGASADNDNLADTPGYSGGDNDPTLDPKSIISSEVDPARVDDPVDFLHDEE